MPNDEEVDIRAKSFEELLAYQANEDKPALVLATLKAFREGEPSAFKMVSQALAEHRYNEENKFPIDDARFKHIITLAAEAIGRGEI